MFGGGRGRSYGGPLSNGHCACAGSGTPRARHTPAAAPIAGPRCTLIADEIVTLYQSRPFARRVTRFDRSARDRWQCPVQVGETR